MSTIEIAKNNSKSNIFKNKKKTFTFALAGNPNCGKTTLFNQLTGSSQYVGNWPGVTVEKKEGKTKYKSNEINIIDLPGIYSLSPYTPEEIVTRNCLLDNSCDLIINIVDATNIERNLYLTTQLAELTKPMIIALNMVDLSKKRGDAIDYKRLEKELDIPIVPISASKGVGLDELMKRAIKVANEQESVYRQIIYSPQVTKAILEIEKIISDIDNSSDENIRFDAVKIFEDDKITLSKYNFSKEQKKLIAYYSDQIKTDKYMDKEMIIADQRYKYICDICHRSIKKGMSQWDVSLSDKIDKVVTNKFLAIPIFLVLMLTIFFITFGPFGTYLKNACEFFIENIVGSNVAAILNKLGASSLAISLIDDGIIGGVGAVISFLPQIMLLFTLLSLLEDSGYMARAAFIMDKLLRKLGLSGRAFVPMLMGFGCTVPAVLGTRTLENEKDKRLTILITPFMSCSAKMPVYALFISAFFAHNQALIILSIYLLGIIVAILTALLFKGTLLKGEPAPFVMELPQYRVPTFKNLCLHVWERVKDFLTKAGTILLSATIVIWFLQTFDFSFNIVTDSSKSILAQIGTIIAPVFTLCGFGNWQSSVSLLTGLIAKESVISTMAVLYNTGVGSELSINLLNVFSPLSAYAFMVFVLLYTPCVAALSAIYKEMHSIKWTLITIFYQLSVAWFVSAMVYQFGTLIMHFI